MLSRENENQDRIMLQNSINVKEKQVVRNLYLFRNKEIIFKKVRGSCIRMGGTALTRCGRANIFTRKRRV